MSQQPDCYEYVRNYYGVPARVGTRVRHGNREGVLVRKRTALHYIHIRFDGTKHPVPAHPTDEIEYLPAVLTGGQA